MRDLLWPMRRRLIQLGLFLLLGAIVNVTVAWGFTIDRGPYDMIVDFPHGGIPLHMSVDRETRQLWMAIVHQKPGRYGIDIVMSFDLDDFIDGTGTDEEELLSSIEIAQTGGAHDVPAWSAARSLASFSELRFDELQTISDRAFGWPCLGLACHWHARVDLLGMVWTRRVECGVRLAPTDKPIPPKPWGMLWYAEVENPLVLPLRLLWPGFAINTLFYAGVLWLLFAAPFALRRRRRIQRGLCPACAYPVGDSEMCTECGRTLPSPSR